jgi:excisionase family DNA binding protein
MKAADVARLLGIVPRSVYFMVREGRIPGALHIGRRVRFEPAEVRRWLAASGRQLNIAKPRVATANRFRVCAEGDKIEILNLPITSRRGGDGSMPDFPVVDALTTDEALNLAAWLVAITDRRGAAFLELVHDIRRFYLPPNDPRTRLEEKRKGDPRS